MKIWSFLLSFLVIISNLYAGQEECNNGLCKYSDGGIVLHFYSKGGRYAITKVDGATFDIKKTTNKEILSMMKKINYDDSFDFTLPFIKWNIDKYLMEEFEKNGQGSDKPPFYVWVIEEITNISINDPQTYNKMTKQFLDELYTHKWVYDIRK